MDLVLLLDCCRSFLTATVSSSLNTFTFIYALIKNILNWRMKTHQGILVRETGTTNPQWFLSPSRIRIERKSTCLAMEWSWPSKTRSTRRRMTHKSKVHTQEHSHTQWCFPEENKKLLDCGFRGGGECYNDRGERSSGRGPGIPFRQAEVSDSVSVVHENSFSPLQSEPFKSVKVIWNQSVNLTYLI